MSDLNKLNCQSPNYKKTRRQKRGRSGLTVPYEMRVRLSFFFSLEYYREKLGPGLGEGTDPFYRVNPG